MSASKEGKDKKVKILGVENISPPKDKQRPATRMKLLNDVGAVFAVYTVFGLTLLSYFCPEI